MVGPQAFAERLPLIRFEDEHLLVIDKPAGMNTHAPGPYAGEGIYDWLRHREPRWASLAIIHRLDKETSGLMVFAKTPLANRSLTEQFTNHTVRKRYRFLTDRPPRRARFEVVSALVRSGEKYLSRPLHAGAPRAETRFRVICQEGDRALLEAEPVTGRTHQIRVHAAAEGLPILGDALYGGTPDRRVCLHAAALTLKHPDGGAELTFQSEADFGAEPGPALRRALLDPGLTNAFRLIHGASDGWPGWYVERFGDFVLSQGERDLTPGQCRHLALLPGLAGAYHKRLNRQVQGVSRDAASPRLVMGSAVPASFVIRENGLAFELSFAQGYSCGLFLDQRDNRRRFLANHVAADFPLFARPPAASSVLNTFAYTCAFSVAAAKAGAHTTSLDLSKKYLDWGRRNFALNGLDPAGHDFIFGDAFDWLRRLARKGRAYDVVVLDPPTFSRSKTSGAFQAESDYGRLVDAALPLVRPDGVLFASTNAADWPAEEFRAAVAAAIRRAGRRVVRQHFAPQPPDFPVSRAEPAYLKTVWLRLA